MNACVFLGMQAITFEVNDFLAYMFSVLFHLDHVYYNKLEGHGLRRNKISAAVKKADRGVVKDIR